MSELVAILCLTTCWVTLRQMVEDKDSRLEFDMRFYFSMLLVISVYSVLDYFLN